MELDITELDITAAEKEANYQELKDYILEKYGTKVSSLNIAQVKEKCGIKERERENYNKPKNADAKQGSQIAVHGKVSLTERETLNSVRGYIIAAQKQVYSAVNSAMVAAYWNIGKQIYEVYG